MKAFTILAVSTAALALTACSDRQDETPITQEAADDMDVAVMDDDAMPVGGELNETQQASYDAMDRQAVSDEYDTNRDAMMADNSSATGNSGAMTSNESSMAGSSSANTNSGSSSMNNSSTGGSTSGSSNNTSNSGNAMQGGSMADGSSGSNVAALPARSQMDFAYLDRNSDGRLSVAEYAIWAVRANPNTPVENDQTKPYISTDQINEAGQTFFYFDQDGNSYLSQSEFTSARNSARTPGGSSM
ncbi:MAG: hypothetical protein MK010_05475 [Erythrobacter sp.]|nr:hypothetical protein [Erythrobacter sp.]